MDSFFGIGLMELVVIAVIALIVLGPERLPGAMRSVANFMRQLRELSSEFTSQFSEEIKMIEELDPRRMINEVLDPSKPANTSNQSAAKPAPPNPTAKGTSAPAKPLTANTPPKHKTETENHSILPPKSTADRPATAIVAPAPGEPPASPGDGGAAAPEATLANRTSVDAEPDATLPTAAEADR